MPYRILLFLFIFTLSCAHHKIRFSRVKRSHTSDAQTSTSKPSSVSEHTVFESVTVHKTIQSDPCRSVEKTPSETVENSEATDELTEKSEHPKTSEVDPVSEEDDKKIAEAKRAELEAMEAKKTMIAALVLFFILPFIWLIPFFFGIGSIKRAEASRYITEEGARALEVAKTIKKVILGILIATLVISVIGLLIFFVFSY